MHGWTDATASRHLATTLVMIISDSPSGWSRIALGQVCIWQVVATTASGTERLGVLLPAVLRGWVSYCQLESLFHDHQLLRVASGHWHHGWAQVASWFQKCNTRNGTVYVIRPHTIVHIIWTTVKSVYVPNYLPANFLWPQSQIVYLAYHLLTMVYKTPLLLHCI